MVTEALPHPAHRRPGDSYRLGSAATSTRSRRDRARDRGIPILLSSSAPRLLSPSPQWGWARRVQIRKKTAAFAWHVSHDVAGNDCERSSHTDIPHTTLLTRKGWGGGRVPPTCMQAARPPVGSEEPVASGELNPGRTQSIKSIDKTPSRLPHQEASAIRFRQVAHTRHCSVKEFH
ncbi:hypothetical protein LZ30DRAFT_65048 [Colletotrichum cereale]|nr:hypothetical protein LZ30DRAFT_65048 [Colletotrichum cereale]